MRARLRETGGAPYLAVPVVEPLDPALGVVVEGLRQALTNGRATTDIEVEGEASEVAKTLLAQRIEASEGKRPELATASIRDTPEGAYLVVTAASLADLAAVVVDLVVDSTQPATKAQLLTRIRTRAAMIYDTSQPAAKRPPRRSRVVP